MPSMSPTKGWNVPSEACKTNISSRDGGVCVLCGIDPVDVVRIVAGDLDEVWSSLLFRHARKVDRLDSYIASSLSLFRKDDPSNLICCE